MVNYNRLGYEIKRDFLNFSEKIAKGLNRPQSKFIEQMIYGGKEKTLYDCCKSVPDEMENRGIF